jgi:hypothetical protein
MLTPKLTSNTVTYEHKCQALALLLSAWYTALLIHNVRKHHFHKGKNGDMMFLAAQ